MKYEIELSSKFKQAFKRLKKKYHSLDKDLEDLISELEQNPTVGADLGNGVRKVRMAISSKGKGKSHGARIITYAAIVDFEEGIITLLTIYDKADQDSITSQEITRLIRDLEEK